MKVPALIQGLSVATVLLVAGSPAYAASFYMNPPVIQLPNDPFPVLVGHSGDTISFSSFIDTTGLTANLKSLTVLAVLDSKEITGLNAKRADAQFLPDFSRQVSVDPNTGLTNIIAVASGPPALPPNFNYRLDAPTITLGSQLNNDGKIDFGFHVLSAIDANGNDVTAQFSAPPPGRGVQAFDIQPAPVPEPSSIFGLVLAGGFGAFLKKQKRKVQH